MLKPKRRSARALACVMTFPKSSASDPTESTENSSVIRVRKKRSECSYATIIPGSFLIWLCQPRGQSAPIMLW